MCGPLTWTVVRSRTSWIGFHLGRLGGYLLLGAAAGAVGEKLLSPGGTLWLSWIATGILAVGLLLAGTRVFSGKGFHLKLLPNRLWKPLQRFAGGNVFLSGILLALLPCGWLHTFVLGAVATQSGLRGSLFLGAFWLGTLPALSVAPWLVTRLPKISILRNPRFAGMVLILASFFTIGMRVFATSHGGEECMVHSRGNP